MPARTIAARMSNAAVERLALALAGDAVSGDGTGERAENVALLGEWAGLGTAHSRGRVIGPDGPVAESAVLDAVAEHAAFCERCGCSELDACLVGGLPCSWTVHPEAGGRGLRCSACVPNGAA